ncbi:P-loop containing nucleoside triphosphate hydrolase protein [Plectosphaerella cucumerina]|uniref:P-loop containing nucleoside triphosphate hydrolase protein n=1 Tax=Plectosphaerella cucumerina TaxID=40658 RepID=A0A8K0T4X1_9PEZI|nr:P-loop containing nucleoside triphosphate hydrolase protein [Plectosphaerella cucumerina]
MESQTVTILFVGDEKCGKTSFLSRVSAGAGTGPIALLRDIDQPYIFEIKMGGKAFRLEFYDNNSPENWRLLRPDLVVLCYDISQRLSLINMQRQWLNDVKTSFQHADTLPLVVLGLKRDLRSETDPNGIIYPQEAYRIAQEMRTDRYVECSAVTGELLKPAFEDICATAVDTTTAAGGQTPGGCALM